MERKLKHLDFVQGVINRLSTNSFLLKGWSVVVVSALTALGADNSKTSYVLLAYLPAVMFWALDGYFLWQERAYRKLYERVRTKDANEIDFCMNIEPVVRDAKGWGHAVLSPTLAWFHGTLILAVLIVTLVEVS